MKENSIEEDIKILENMNDGYTFKDCDMCNNYNEKTKCCDKHKCMELQAIERVLLDYKRVLKENEELKEYNMTYKRILGLADNRIYRKKYLEERRKEQPNLLYPDSDEIYQRYYELKEENEHLHREINRRIKLKIENEKIVDTQFIYKPKVKDKIEKLHKLLADIDYKDIEDKHEREFYKKEYYQVVAQIKVLKELLDESEENKCGTN